ncbi:MAG: Rieske 2Fe-2S domain-containing protein, partial [Caldilineaceae bacterium]|nr:Rieske 2Fe-2S domain-containing protein [Caldilineaceae bacterium]
MIDDPILVNDWHPLCRAEAVAPGGVLSARLLSEDLVVWRPQVVDGSNPSGPAVDNSVKVWRDLCIHRGARLSLGQVNNRGLACPYHGWTYDGGGRCVHIPTHPEQVPPA